MPRKVYLIRHGTKAWVNGKKKSDQTGCNHDPPVKDYESLSKTVEALKPLNLNFTHVFCSPFLRCRQTVFYMIDGLKQKEKEKDDPEKEKDKQPVVLKELGEYLGNHGHVRMELDQHTLPCYTPMEYKLMGTEGISRLRLRVRKFVDMLKKLPEDSVVMVVTHGIVINEIAKVKLDEGAFTMIEL